MLVLAFDGAMAASSPHDWVHSMLGGQLGAAGVVTGEDFTFGKGRSGSVATLRDMGAQIGMGARAVPAVLEGGAVVSSSRIRAALREGDVATATAAHPPFAIRGTVQHGDKLGRTIGFPTANLPLGNYLRPAYGIYAVTGCLPGGRVVQGAANLGIRPHFDPPKELLEPHFFDFSGDLYGAEIEVAFHAFLRPEAKFENLDALVAQIGRDCDAARKF
jgi:riboflavin kinase/FMN adenylyltransferase